MFILGHGEGVLSDFLPKILAMFENFKYEVFFFFSYFKKKKSLPYF